LIVFIIHKLNYKKPVMKIILFHFLIRSIGNILYKLSSVMTHYYTNIEIKEGNKVVGYGCNYEVSLIEMHPLRWLITKQLVTLFWSIGEIIADWYPLIRTKEIVDGDKSLWIIYTTCILYNLSKIGLVFHFFTINSKDLYNDQGVFQMNKLKYYNNRCWIIHLIIIYTCVIYNISVFLVLKKRLKLMNKMGSLNKFLSISEYRICFFLLVCIILYPIVSVTIILRLYYSIKYDRSLDFTFENIRTLLVDSQYYMMFIDQILLVLSKESYNVDLSHFLCNVSDINEDNGKDNDKTLNNSSMKSKLSSSTKSKSISSELRLNDLLNSPQCTLINNPDNILPNNTENIPLNNIDSISLNNTENNLQNNIENNPQNNSENNSLNNLSVDQSSFTNITNSNQNNSNSIDIKETDKLIK